MKLVQKLPIGLSLACMIMMTSCSKEDAQTPEPKVESVNASSNLKTDALPWVPPTKGNSGIGIYPSLWERYNPLNGASNAVAYPAGTSSLTSLWGNNEMPWVQSLSTIPAQPWTSFLTTTSSSKWDTKKRSFVKTSVRFLNPGKKYSLTFYVSTTLPKYTGRGTHSPTFAQQCAVGLSSAKSTPQFFSVDLTNYKNTWVQKTITFTAKSSEMDFDFSASPAKEGQYTYAHIFVGQDAILEVK